MLEEADDNNERNIVLRRLYLASALCTSFLIVEVVGGYLSGSLAIGASHVASLPSTSQHTYGLKRMESLAALLSMVSLAAVSVALAAEAVRRLFWMPVTDIDGPLMSGIAAIGVAVNVVLALVLGPEHHVHLPGSGDHSHNHSHDHAEHTTESTPLVDLQHHHVDEVDHDHSHDHHSHDNHSHSSEKRRNVNLHAAYLHVLGDLAQSVAVLIAGLVIWWKPSWHLVDPIVTLLFCTMVFYSTLSVIRNSVAVLLEEVPPHIDWESVHDAISNVQNVERVHDLHIW